MKNKHAKDCPKVSSDIDAVARAIWESGPDSFVDWGEVVGEPSLHKEIRQMAAAAMNKMVLLGLAPDPLGAEDYPDLCAPDENVWSA